jgi:hypothetical protein
MLANAKQRAKRAGIPFDLTLDMLVIPDICPVLGTRLVTGHTSFDRNSPSLDRIRPSLGYVAGNIQVMSNQANLMKRDATEAELQMFCRYFLKEEN